MNINKRLSYQYYKGVSAGLIVMSVIFTIPIIASLFIDWKYTGLSFLLANYIIGFIALFEMIKQTSEGTK